MPKLVPGIHALGREYARKAWRAGTSPAMMKERVCRYARLHLLFAADTASGHRAT
jgi:hypothetical protein